MKPISMLEVIDVNKLIQNEKQCSKSRSVRQMRCQHLRVQSRHRATFFIMLCDWCLQIKCRSRVFMVYFEKEHANGNIEITRKLRRRLRIKRRTTTILKPTRTPRKIRTTNKKNRRNNEKNKNKNKKSIDSIIYSLKQRQKVSTRNSDIFMQRRLRLSCKISLHVGPVPA